MPTTTYDDEPGKEPMINLKRLVRRAWLVLSACWVFVVFIVMVAEPNIGGMILARPLRTLGAMFGAMLAPPVIVYGTGLLAVASARWARGKWRARVRGDQRA
jgi:hypothetical protein